MAKLLHTLLLGLALGTAAAPALGTPEPEATAEHAGHGDHHDPEFSDINWVYGILGEKEGVEPSLLYRRPGMPIPMSVLLFNSAVLFFLLYRIGKKPLAEALVRRKEGLMQGMDEAAKMHEEAKAALANYQAKLEHISDEIERVQREMREASEQEKQRILGEARERRERMTAEARLLVQQELKAAREQVMEELTREVVTGATALLAKQLGATDQQRLAEEYLQSLDGVGLNATGGRA